jgi:Flp pilus assembly protein TadD
LNLAQVYAAAGNYAKAEPLLRKVVEMSPDYPMGQNALAHLLLSQGKNEEAEQVFTVARKLGERTRAAQPRTWIAALNIAYMRHREKDVPGALAILEQAIAEYPGTWPLLNLHAELLSGTQGPRAAIPLVEEFVRHHWWHLPANLALAKLHLADGNLDRAEQLLRGASWLDVYDAESLNVMALISIQRDQLGDAYSIQRRAVARQPHQPRQYVLLADVLRRMGRADEARVALAQVSHLESLARGAALTP